MADCGHPLHRARGPVCPCGLWSPDEDSKTSIEKYDDPVHTNPSEVRHISCGDTAGSGDQTG